MSKNLQEQYEAYPYPHRDPKNSAPIITLINDLALIGHYGFGGKNWCDDKDCRVLIAGGGTGDATVHLAEQFAKANPNAEIIHLDLSQASIDITQARLDHKELKNVKVIQGSLLDLPKGDLGTFDYINCSGVLHHLENPDQGAQALCSALKDHGVMSIMLYGEYGRRIIYDIQNMAKMVTAKDEDLADRIPVVREILDTLPADNPLRNMFPLEMPDNELVDRYLHSQDRAYTVPQIYEMMDSAKLQLISFLPSANYNPLPFISEGDLHKRISALPEEQKLAYAEIMHGTMGRHMFFATKSSNTLPPPPDLENLSFIPVLIAAGERLRQTSFPNGVEFAKPFPERLEPPHLRIVSKFDGKTSLEDIFTACKEQFSMDKSRLKTLWLDIYRILSTRGHLALRTLD